MSDSYVEAREKYIYVKMKNLKEGDQLRASEQVAKLLDSSPETGVLIDDSEIRYKDLNPALELEAVKAIEVCRRSPKVAVVIDPSEEKLHDFASFMLSTVRVDSMKVVTELDDAVIWLTSYDSKNG